MIKPPSFLLAACLLFAGTAVSQDTGDTGPKPFLKFRDRTLEYAGPELDESKPAEKSAAELGIAWFGPSDPADPLHGGTWWAVSLAVEEANRRGGCRGNPFRLLPCWAKDRWGTGVSQLARLVYQESPLAVLGSVDGPGTHLAEQIVAKARLSLVSPVSTDTSVNLAGVPWMFSCAPGDDRLAELLTGHLVAAHPDPEDHCAVFSATDHDSRVASSEILKALSKRKRSPSHRFEFDPENPDLRVQLEALKLADPEVIIISAGPDDAARLVQALRQSRLDISVFGTAPLARRRFRQLAGPAAEGVRFPLLFPPESPDERTRRFVDKFKTRFGAEPDYAEALAYDAACLLLQAICSSDPNRARIREAIFRSSPWPGITGPISWDGTGQNTRPLSRMGTISGGEIRALGETEE